MKRYWIVTDSGSIFRNFGSRAEAESELKMIYKRYKFRELHPQTYYSSKWECKRTGDRVEIVERSKHWHCATHSAFYIREVEL